LNATAQAQVFDFCSVCKQLMLAGQSYSFCLPCAYFICNPCSLTKGANGVHIKKENPKPINRVLRKIDVGGKPIHCRYPSDAKKETAATASKKRKGKTWTFEVQIQKPKGSLGLLLTEHAWPGKRYKKASVTVRGFHKAIKRVRDTFEQGDELVMLNGREMSSALDVSTESSKVGAGEYLTFLVKRSNLAEELKILNVTKPPCALGLVIRVGPETAGKAILKSLHDATKEIKESFKKDDEIVSINGRGIQAPEDITDVLERVPVGQEIQFCIKRMVLKEYLEASEELAKKRVKAPPVGLKESYVQPQELVPQLQPTTNGMMPIPQAVAEPQPMDQSSTTIVQQQLQAQGIPQGQQESIEYVMEVGGSEEQQLGAEEKTEQTQETAKVNDQVVSQEVPQESSELQKQDAQSCQQLSGKQNETAMVDDANQGPLKREPEV